MSFERHAQLAILAHWRSSLVIAAPNYTPRDWWECDVWGVTRAGYWVEWEIKASLADFRADRAKSTQVITADLAARFGWTTRQVRKHEAIRESGPSRFWYVVPDDLGLLPHDVPDWAGLATVRAGNRWRVKVEKDAPILGRRKVPRREIRLAQTRMWRRYWTCLERLHARGIEEPEISE